MDDTRKAYPGRPRTVKIAAIAVVIMLGVVGALVFLMNRPGVEVVDDYSPTRELPPDYMIITDYPQNEEDLLAIATLSPLVQKGKDAPYHPLIVMDPEGGLSSQELYTLSHLRTDRDKILFTNAESSIDTINSQLSDAALSPIAEENTFPLTPEICSIFEGFDDVMTVASYEEALWATTAACTQNLAMVKGKASFLSQDEAWEANRALGISSDYILATNPHDHSLEALKAGTPDYDEYDDPWFCPDLSLMTGQMSAHHNAYVITSAPPTPEADWEINMELSQNRRAVGYYDMIRHVASGYGTPEYVAIVGSASAVPQFLMSVSGEGDMVNSDIFYGFLDDDRHTMDAGLGRIIQFEVSLASNQLAKTYMFDDFVDLVHVDYRDVAGGPQEKDWRTHGASFSGFDITYKRMQATPARWICKDFEDLGWTYDYIGPFNTGNQIADGVINSMENDISEICEGSGYVAYRGHGSDYGSLYGIRVYGPNGDEHQLSSDTAAQMNVPPQVAFFVSCLNGKIYGHGPGTDPGSDVDFDRLFTLNYLSAGPAVLIGATEVSYSNIGQDLYSIPAEYLPWSDGDHQWDHNDAWYAFVWDGILDHPDEHGTAGKALQWSENRYMAYPPNNDPTPYEPTGEVDWYEVTFFACYGDPSFKPAVDISSPGYDPWHNGPDDM